MSEVWKFYTKKEQGKVECNVCKATLAYRNGSTSALHKHCERWHPEIRLQKANSLPATSASSSTREKQQQPTVQCFVNSKTALLGTSPKGQSITEAIVDMICLDLQPLAFTEDYGFRKLMKKSEPRYQIPSRVTFKREIIPNLYEEVWEKLKNEITTQQTTKGSFSVTTDGWTSNNNKSYITYTLHYVTAEFELAAYNIGTFEIETDHTADNLTRHICHMFRKCGILNSSSKKSGSGDEARDIILDLVVAKKEQTDETYLMEHEEQGDAVDGDETIDSESVSDHWTAEYVTPEDLSEIKSYHSKVCITTDNDDSIAKAVRDSPFNHVPCFAHTLNLAVQRSLKITSVKSLLSKIRMIVGHFHNSNKARYALQRKQKKEKKPLLQLVMDVVSRWNSSYEMIDRFLFLHKQVYAALLTLKHNELLRTMRGIDIDVLEHIRDLLKPFKEVTVVMSTESSSFISLIRPLMRQLMQHCDNSTVAPDNLSPAIHEMRQTIYTDLETRYLDNVEDLDTCTFLDPRVKGLPYLSKEERDSIFCHVYDIAISTLNKDASSDTINADTAMLRTQTAHNTGVGLSGLLGPMYYSVTETSDCSGEGNQQVKEVVAFEVRRYLQEIPCSMNANPLEWWKRNASKYARLSQLARNHLAIQGTSVASERVFSSAGAVLSTLRSRIDSKLVNQIVFLNKNLKTLGGH